MIQNSRGAVNMHSTQDISRCALLRAGAAGRLALLSVLGGVEALGAIGILVGPMVVAFLQTLLNMVHTELNSLARSAERRSPSPAPASRQATL